MSRWALAAVLVLLAAGACFAQAPAPDAKPADARRPAAEPALPAFRRIIFPAEKLDARNWRQHYLPVDAAEFERHLRTIYDHARGAPDPQRARIERAECSVQLQGDDLLSGTVVWHLTSSAKASLLPLEPCGVAIESAQWLEPARPAVMGVDGRGRLCVLVEGTRLSCQWSLRGERTAAGAVKFSLRLPDCGLARMELETPAGFELSADGGIVLLKSAADKGPLRWSVDFGGHEQLILRVASADAASRRRPLTLLRQALTYEFSSRGIDVTAQLRLDVHGEPLTRAALDLDPGLNLISAKYGEQAIPWSSTTDTESGRSQVVLEFAEPMTGTGRVLQLAAVAPLSTKAAFRLPGIQPQDVAWQEGTAELILPDSLSLDHLVTVGCRQSGLRALPAPLAGESFEIQYFRPGASIEVHVTEKRRRPKVAAASSVEVGASEIVAETSIAPEKPPTPGETLRLPIGADWTIDSVESLPPGPLVEWDVESAAGHSPTLSIARAAAPVLVVRGRRPLPEAASFEASELLMLNLAEVGGTDRLIGVRSAEGIELRWSGAEELGRLDAASLAADQRRLFALAPEGMLLSLDDRFAQATLRVERPRPSYAADIHVDAAVQRDRLTETVTIQCTPDTARVERLLIHFSQSREVPLEWNLAGGNNSGQFSARKLSPGEQVKAGLPAEGEVWELLLQLARPGAFELRAQRSLPFDAETPLALVSVEGATTQRGTLAIRALGDTGLSIDNRGLMSVPAELLEPGRYQTARGTFHYQPSGDDLGSDPVVRIAPAPPQASATGVWAWQMNLESRFAADGAAAHQATISLETGGRRRLLLKLPPDARLHEVMLDGNRLPLPEVVDDKGLPIELTAGRSHASLVVDYTTAADLPAVATRVVAPYPELDVPVVGRRWSVWLPPGFAAVESAGPVDQLAPLTWSQRMFGPLARGPLEHVFNPLVAADWRQTFAGAAAARQTDEAGQRFVANLGVLAGEHLDNEGLTWGQLLAGAAETEQQLDRVLLVDQVLLLEQGIAPQNRVAGPFDDAPRNRGAALLRQARLAVIATPVATLLTTTAGAARLSEQLLGEPGAIVQRAGGGTLARDIATAASRSGWSPYETVEVWRTGGVPQLDEQPLASTSLGDRAGWSNYTMRGTDDADLAMSVVHVARMRSLAWALFLAAVGCGLWQTRVRPSILPAATAFAAAIALVAPVAYVPLFSALVLAGLFCLVVRMTNWSIPAPRSLEPATAGKPGSTITHSLARLLILASLVPAASALGAGQAGSATDTTTAAAPDKRPVHSVFVPVDDEGRVVGNKYYVPESLYADLLRRADAIQGLPRGWMIARCAYQGSLARDPITSRQTVSSLRLRFDLQVFQSQTRVELPLSRAAWGAAIATVRVDGREITPSWNADGTALSLGALDEGQSRLEMDVRPAAAPEQLQSAIDMPVPPVPGAVLELTLPPDAAEVDVVTARGATSYDRQRGVLTARLGNADRLTARWSNGGAMDGSTPSLEVEELIWMKVRPGTTVLDARFKYRVLAGRVRHLQLLADPRLRLLSSPHAGSNLAAVHTIPGDPQRIDLELREAASGEVNVDLSFLVSGASGVGNLRLPRLESSGTSGTRRWLAVSVDPALEPRIQAGDGSAPLAIADFLAAWNTDGVQPYATYSIPRGEPIWFLATQPREPQAGVQQALRLSFGRTQAAFQYDGELSISGGVLGQLALSVPPGIEIDKASVLDEQVERVTRWSVDPSGRVSIFLNAPLEGSQRLKVTGRWTLPAEPSFLAPRIELESARLERSAVTIFRQPPVLVQIEPQGSVRPQPPPAQDETSTALQAFCGSFLLDGPESRLRVQLTPNTPNVRALSVTSLERDEDLWVAEMRCHVEVRQGLVDSLQFEIPSQWSEPFRIEPAMRHRVAVVPGEQRRQLILYPQEPISTSQSIAIRARVASSPGDRLSVPDIVPLHVQELERYVILPLYLDFQQVTWDTLRLSPAELPQQLAATGVNSESISVYQVAGEHFQASLKAVERDAAATAIGLLDVRAAWLPDGGYRALATAHLQPGGARHCTLELPADCRLIHVSVEQLPAMLRPESENRWQLSLGPEQLPQQIEILYEGRSAAGRLDARIEAPRFGDVAVARTLWSLYGLPRLGGGELAGGKSEEGGQRVNPAEQHLSRLSSIAAMVELPAEVIGEHLPEEIARWYSSRRKSYGAERAALRRELIAAGRPANQSLEGVEARQLDQRLTEVDRKLGITAAAPREPASDASARFARLVSGLRPTYLAASGESAQILLRHSSANVDTPWKRWLAALALAVSAGATATWFRPQRLPVVAPWAALCIAGAVWWLLFAPSVLGLAAVIAGVVAAIWGGRQSSPSPLPA